MNKMKMLRSPEPRESIENGFSALSLVYTEILDQFQSWVNRSENWKNRFSFIFGQKSLKTQGNRKSFDNNNSEKHPICSIIEWIIAQAVRFKTRQSEVCSEAPISRLWYLKLECKRKIINLKSKNKTLFLSSCSDGVVGYHDRLTRGRSRVQIPI